MTIQTRILAERAELVSVREAMADGVDVSDFDYLDADEHDEPRLVGVPFKDHVEWYDALDTMYLADSTEWDSYADDTFFSRVVFKFLGHDHNADEYDPSDEGFVRVGYQYATD